MPLATLSVGHMTCIFTAGISGLQYSPGCQKLPFHPPFPLVAPLPYPSSPISCPICVHGYRSLSPCMSAAPNLHLYTKIHICTSLSTFPPIHTASCSCLQPQNSHLYPIYIPSFVLAITLSHFCPMFTSACILYFYHNRIS